MIVPFLHSHMCDLARHFSSFLIDALVFAIVRLSPAGDLDDDDDDDDDDDCLSTSFTGHFTTASCGCHAGTSMNVVMYNICLANDLLKPTICRVNCLYGPLSLLSDDRVTVHGTSTVVCSSVACMLI
jgi:hypothetical protein